MAKTVKEFGISLKLLNTGELKTLGSSFKELDKVLNTTDDRLKKLRSEIINYRKETGASEQLIKGQIAALKGLQGQANVNSKTYQQLDSDIRSLKETLVGATEATQRKREALLKAALATKGGSSAVKGYIGNLKKLRSQTRENSDAFKQFTKDIDGLTDKMRLLKQQEMADFSKNFSKNTKANFQDLRKGLGETIEFFKRLGTQSKTALGAVGRSVEGLAALGAGGKVAGLGAGAVSAALGSVTGAQSYLTGAKATIAGTPLVGGQLEKLIPDSAISSLAQYASTLSNAQVKLSGLEQVAGGVVKAVTAFGPTATAGAVAASAAIAIIYDRLRNEAEKTRKELEESFTGVDDEVQDLLRSLVKLRDQLTRLSSSRIGELLSGARQRFAGAPAGSPLSRAMASQIAGLESMSAQEASAQAAVLEEYRQRVRGTSQSATSLGERLSYVNARLKEVDHSTDQGRKEFADYSREAVQLTQKLNSLADGYRHVSTMANQAASSQANYANSATVANYLNRGAVRAQESAFAELGARIRAGVTGTPLALPAAGQTTAPGTGEAISGGARFGARRTTILNRAVMRPSPGEEMLPKAYGPQMTEEQLDRYQRSLRSATEATQAQARADEGLRQKRLNLNRAVVDARKANNGSIDSTDRLRQALVALRNQVDPTEREFRQLTREIELLDQKSEKFALNQRKRISAGSRVKSAVGGALSGAVFGGPEAALGGLIGGLGFGPAGAAAGAFAGAQVSAIREQAAAVGRYSAELSLAKKTLAQAATSQEEYNRLLTLARKVSNDYSVSLKPSIGGLAQIATAARANNLTLEQTETIYRGLIAANVAFGKGQEDLDAIIRATVQVLSKGKVSAEELSGQIGERLPGAVAKFAAANKMTLPELTKAFKDGQVTIAQFVNFARSQGEEYDGIARKIAEGPEKAGLRLQIALDNSAEQFGGFFAKIGAGFQDFLTQLFKFVNENADAIKQFITDWVNASIVIGVVTKRLFQSVLNIGKVVLQMLATAMPLLNIFVKAYDQGVQNLLNIPAFTREIAAMEGIKQYSVKDLFGDGAPTTFGKGGLTAGGGDGDGGGGAGGDKAAKDLARRIAASKEVVRRLKDQLEISKQQRPLDAFLAKQAKDRSDFEAQFAKLRKDGKDATIEQAYKEAEILLTRKERADLEKFYFDNLRGIGTQLSENLDKEKELSRELLDRRYALGMVGKDEYVSSQLDAYRDQLTGQGYSEERIAEAMEVRRQELDPTPFEQMRQNIAQLKQELTDLVNPVNQIVGAAATIGQAFSTSFINVINGSQTAREALASFFKNIGNYFLDMAAQIIAKMIQMAILNSIVGLLPGAPAAGAGAGSMGGLNMPTGIGDSYKSLLVPKRAYGGPVKGKMPYIVGENGPELYVPGMSGKIVPNHKLPKMVDLGGKFMPFHPLFMAAMFGLGNFGGNRQAVMEMFGAKFSPYSGGAMVGRAAGGPVTGGSPYLVGESGPEMYVPQGFSAGSMKSTSNNVVVNVNASGSQAEGDAPDSKRLGEAIGAAVRQELMRQQRPGGILA